MERDGTRTIFISLHLSVVWSKENIDAGSINVARWMGMMSYFCYIIGDLGVSTKLKCIYATTWAHPTCGLRISYNCACVTRIEACNRCCIDVDLNFKSVKNSYAS